MKKKIQLCKKNKSLYKSLIKKYIKLNLNMKEKENTRTTQ